MYITVSELESNIDKYLDMAADENILITRDGQLIAKLSNAKKERLDTAISLFGILEGYDDERSYDEIKWEAMKERYDIDD